MFGGVGVGSGRGGSVREKNITSLDPKKPGTRAHSPEPPFYKSALLFPIDS